MAPARKNIPTCAWTALGSPRVGARGRSSVEDGVGTEERAFCSTRIVSSNVLLSPTSCPVRLASLHGIYTWSV